MTTTGPSAPSAQSIDDARSTEGSADEAEGRDELDDRVVDEVGVAVVGTGFSGLCVAIKLLEDGNSDFVVFERAGRVGGTWRDNTYPGAECDIRANLYSYSFAPNPDWSKAYGTREELDHYLSDCAERFGVTPHIRFDHAVESAAWNADTQRWEIHTSQGMFTAKVLVSGMGYLSEPRIPDIAGLDDFDGPVFHTASWDHDVELTGKRVAVIGTGASSVQVVPAIQPDVEHLDVYQRSPAWIMAKHDTPNTGIRGWFLRRFPGGQRANRLYNRWALELLICQLARPRAMVVIERMAAKHLKKSVPDQGLRAKLTPDYTMGCKRMLFSNGYYPALQEDNVDLVCDPIDRLTSDGVVTADGVHHPVDVIALATGFQANRLPFASLIRGAEGTLLSDIWHDHQFAYLGATVPGFPNFFMVLGPNTTVGHTSATLMTEAAARYVVDAVKTMQRNGLGSVDPRTEVVAAYNRRLQKRLSKSVWNAGGCNSWYVDHGGVNTTVWPRTATYYERLTRRFDPDDYRSESVRSPVLAEESEPVR
jgi:cation diffusion facilitator CzcD-associated flavoprotein CzcO